MDGLRIADGVLVDYILFIKATVDLAPNLNEVQDTRYVSAEELKEMFKDEKLKFTPWFKLICHSMLFESALSLRIEPNTKIIGEGFDHAPWSQWYGS